MSGRNGCWSLCVVASVALLPLLHPGPAPAQETERWQLIEELRIGSMEDETHALTRVGAIALRDRVLVVSQPRDARLRAFTSDGAPVTEVGRAGDGPGEFRSIAGLGWMGDTLYVADGRLGRITFYDEGLQLLGTMPFLGRQLGSFRIYAPRSLHRGGDAIVLPGRSYGMPSGDPGPEVGTPILRTGWSGDVRDTVATVSRENAVLVVRRGGRSTSYRNQPFSDAPVVDIASDASYVVIVEREVPEQRRGAFYRVVKVGLDGDTMVANPVAYAPVQIPEAAKVGAIGSIVEQVHRGEPIGETRRLVRESLYLPEYHPPVAEVSVGTDGRIWLRRNPPEEGMVRWDLLSPEGTPIAHVILPPRLRILESAGEMVWAQWRNKLDITYLVRYRLVRP